jgi:hypothetical protein
MQDTGRGDLFFLNNSSYLRLRNYNLEVRIHFFLTQLLGLPFDARSLPYVELIITEYANGLLAAIILAYLLLSKKTTLGQILSLKKKYVEPVVFFALPLLALGAYNTINFGNPLDTAYKYSPQHSWVGSLSEALTGSLSEGVTGLLFTSKDVQGGLFVITPALILAIWGLAYLYEKRRNETFLITALFVVHLLFYGKYKTYNGGGTADTRYLVTVTPLIVLPIFMWVEEFLLKRKTTIEKIFFEGCMWALISISVLNVMHDVAVFEGHGIREFRLPALWINDFATDFFGLFPNIGLIPAYIGILCIAYLLASLALKRTPFLKLNAFEGGKAKPQLFGLGVAGVVLLLITSGVPKGAISISDWKYSSDGLQWTGGEPPFKSDSQRMIVKGTVDITGPMKSAMVKVAASDCIKWIYVNNQPVYMSTNCTVCLHCGGAPLDLAQVMQPGRNSIAFEIIGLGNSTQFTLQKS